MLPKSIACNIAFKLLKLTSLQESTNEFKKNIYFAIETLFASTALPAEFTEDFLKEMMKSLPEVYSTHDSVMKEVELMVVGYSLSLS
jgi:hypothetical protein